MRQLGAKKATLAVAESCTGGFLAHRLTNVPGASAVFLAGYVTYSNEAKVAALGVDAGGDLRARRGQRTGRPRHGGRRAREVRSDFALATTGIAGPGGGSAVKPVGTAYIALAGGGETVVRHFFFPTDRETFKQLVTQTALNLLRERLNGGGGL